MNTTRTLAAGAALALALSGGALAQQAGHGPDHGNDGQMMQDGMMSPEMHGEMHGETHDEMHDRMREMMRPMMREMMREMMAERQAGAAPEAPAADHDAHHAAGDPRPVGSPATEAYRAANTAMHEAMDIEFSDDADIDFARGMIGHHLGAIDMARIVLEHGEDEDLRQLAEEIIEAQEAEIQFLRDWLAEREE
jgi:hypothetical protein